MPKIHGYSLGMYGEMITDHVRVDAYVEAIRRSIRPGDIVLDIGSGPGLFALLACQMGAGKVYALEPDNSIIIASEIARENGFAERIEFIQEISTLVTLPDKANLIISDLRGILPMLELHIPTIIDARQRLLGPDGVLIPQKDDLFVAIVEDPKSYQSLTSPWLDKPYQINLHASVKYVLNDWQKTTLTHGQLLSDPQTWANLDYRSISSANIQGQVELTVLRSGQAHGLGVWFDTELIEGVRFSNAPNKPPLIYGQGFFPFLEPIDVQSEDIFVVSIRADLIGNDYEWTWKTHHLPGGHIEKECWDFEQSTLFYTPISLNRLKKMSPAYSPSLSQEGLATCFMLDRIDGSRTLEEVARSAAKRFPEQFPDWKAALILANELSAKYTK